MSRSDESSTSSQPLRGKRRSRQHRVIESSSSASASADPVIVLSSSASASKSSGSPPLSQARLKRQSPNKAKRAKALKKYRAERDPELRREQRAYRADTAEREAHFDAEIREKRRFAMKVRRQTAAGLNQDLSESTSQSPKLQRARREHPNKYDNTVAFAKCLTEIIVDLARPDKNAAIQFLINQPDMKNTESQYFAQTTQDQISGFTLYFPDDHSKEKPNYIHDTSSIDYEQTLTPNQFVQYTECQALFYQRLTRLEALIDKRTPDAQWSAFQLNDNALIRIREKIFIHNVLVYAKLNPEAQSMKTIKAVKALYTDRFQRVIYNFVGNLPEPARRNQHSALIKRRAVGGMSSFGGLRSQKPEKKPSHNLTALLKNIQILHAPDNFEQQSNTLTAANNRLQALITELTTQCTAHPNTCVFLARELAEHAAASEPNTIILRLTPDDHTYIQQADAYKQQEHYREYLGDAQKEPILEAQKTFDALRKTLIELIQSYHPHRLWAYINLGRGTLQQLKTALFIANILTSAREQADGFPRTICLQQLRERYNPRAQSWIDNILDSQGKIEALSHRGVLLVRENHIQKLNKTQQCIEMVRRSIQDIESLTPKSLPTTFIFFNGDTTTDKITVHLGIHRMMLLQAGWDENSYEVDARNAASRAFHNAILTRAQQAAFFAATETLFTEKKRLTSCILANKLAAYTDVEIKNKLFCLFAHNALLATEYDIEPATLLACYTLDAQENIRRFLKNPRYQRAVDNAQQQVRQRKAIETTIMQITALITQFREAVDTLQHHVFNVSQPTPEGITPLTLSLPDHASALTSDAEQRIALFIELLKSASPSLPWRALAFSDNTWIQLHEILCLHNLQVRFQQATTASAQLNIFQTEVPTVLDFLKQLASDGETNQAHLHAYFFPDRDAYNTLIKTDIEEKLTRWVSINVTERSTLRQFIQQYGVFASEYANPDCLRDRELSIDIYFSVLRSQPTVQRLALSCEETELIKLAFNQFTSDAGSVCPQIGHLDFSDCNLTYEDVLDLAAFIKRDKCITSINLEGNNLSNDSILALLKALKQNRTLTHFWINTNSEGESLDYNKLNSVYKSLAKKNSTLLTLSVYAFRDNEYRQSKGVEKLWTDKMEMDNIEHKATLFTAVRDGELKTVQVIFKNKQHASVYATTDEGNTPLHVAVSQGHRLLVIALLRLTPNRHLQNKQGLTAEALAGQLGNTKIVSLFEQTLLPALSVPKKDKKKKSPQPRRATSPPPSEPPAKRQKGTLDAFIVRTPPSEAVAPMPVDGENLPPEAVYVIPNADPEHAPGALYFAMKNGEHERAAHLARQYPNMQAPTLPISFFRHACLTGTFNLATQFATPENVDKEDALGQTPLLLTLKAFHQGDADHEQERLAIIQWLVDEGADITHTFYDYMFSVDGVTLLHRAIAQGFYYIAEYLITQSPVLLNQPDGHGRTPLMWCVAALQDRIFSRLIIEADIDLDHLDNEGDNVEGFLEKQLAKTALDHRPVDFFGHFEGKATDRDIGQLTAMQTQLSRYMDPDTKPNYEPHNALTIWADTLTVTYSTRSGEISIDGYDPNTYKHTRLKSLVNDFYASNDDYSKKANYAETSFTFVVGPPNSFEPNHQTYTVRDPNSGPDLRAHDIFSGKADEKKSAFFDYLEAQADRVPGHDALKEAAAGERKRDKKRRSRRKQWIPMLPKHSEQTTFAHMTQPHYLALLLNALKEDMGADYEVGMMVYAIVIDIHTKLTMCENCQLVAHATTHPDSLFSQCLREALPDEGFAASTRGIRIFTRVSCQKPMQRNPKPVAKEDHCRHHIDLRANSSAQVVLHQDILQMGEEPGGNPSSRFT